MTTTEHPNEVATAAASGASATERFHADKSPFEAVKDTPPPERVATLINEVLAGVHDTIRKHKVTYDEYNALKAWLINVGEDGEWPLFLDVWVEHVVEDVATEHREGNKGSIEGGPYYVPNAPDQGSKGAVPMREDEKGDPLLWNGQVRSCDGTPARGRQGRAVARRRRRLLLAVRTGHPGMEPARHLHHRRPGQLRDHHDPPGAVYDPDGRLLRKDDLGGRLAPVASRPPAPQGVGTRPRAADRAAVLPR